MKGTVKSKEEFDFLFTEAEIFKAPHVMLRFLPKEKIPEKRRGQTGRVAFIVGKRIGGAVERNRGKRVLREAVRRCDIDLQGSLMAFVARNRGVLSATPAQLEQECAALVRRAFGRR